MTEEFKLDATVTNSGTEVVQIFSNWLCVEEVWLAHVVESNGTCGCAFDVEMGNHFCNYWTAVENKRKADSALARELKTHFASLKEKGQ